MPPRPILVAVAGLVLSCGAGGDAASLRSRTSPAAAADRLLPALRRKFTLSATGASPGVRTRREDGYATGSLTQLLGQGAHEQTLYKTNVEFADYGAVPTTKWRENPMHTDALGYTISIDSSSCSQFQPMLLARGEQPTDGCKLVNWRPYRICKPFEIYPFLITATWSPNQTCTAYQILKAAKSIGATGVMIIAPECTGHACNVQRKQILSVDPNSRALQPAIDLPLVMIDRSDGDQIVRNSWIYDSVPSRAPIWSKIDAGDDKDPTAPRNMVVMTIAAPLVIFGLLMVSRIFRRDPVRRYEYERRTRQEAMANALREFVDELEETTHAALALEDGPAALARENTDKCPICIDEFEPEDVVRHLPCPCRYLYHKDCIDPWLLDNGTCPTCKKPFLDRGDLVPYHGDETSSSDDTDDTDDTDGADDTDDTDASSTSSSAAEHPGRNDMEEEPLMQLHRHQMARPQRRIYVDEETTSEEDDSESRRLSQPQAVPAAAAACDAVSSSESEADDARGRRPAPRGVRVLGFVRGGRRRAGGVGDRARLITADDDSDDDLLPASTA